MIRTVITLENEDKAWLDQVAQAEHVSMTEVVRRAIRAYRQQESSHKRILNTLLEQTSGIWKQGDGLKYQRKIRSEWN